MYSPTWTIGFRRVVEAVVGFSVGSSSSLSEKESSSLRTVVVGRSVTIFFSH